MVSYTSKSNNAFIEIKCVKFDSENVLKKLIRRLSDMMLYSVTVGVNKAEGRKKAGKKINMAKLASVLEEGMSWTQSKTKRIPTKIPVKNPNTGKDEYWATIKAGTNITIPKRIFINLPEIPAVWNKIKLKIDSYVTSYLNVDSYIKNGRAFWKLVGQEIELNQKDRVANNYGENAPLTKIIKGFTNPLFHFGFLLNSITYKIQKGWETGKKKELRLDLVDKFKQMAGLK